MTEQNNQFDSSLSAPKHWIAVAVILACGMVGGALILRSPGAAAPAAASGHADADEHKDGEHHGEAADKHDDHKEAESHADAEHHDEAEHGHEEEEGHVKLTEAQSKKVGVTLAKAGAAAIRKEVV